MRRPSCRAPLLAALLPPLLAGCILLPVAGPRAGRSIDFAPSQLVPGRTTRADLLRVLGQPAAVAAPGADVEVPTLSLPPLAGPGLPPGQTWVVQAEAWFALFLDRPPPGPAHRVYYWATTSSWGLRLVMLGILGAWDYASMEELWALVDEESGLVLAVARRAD